MVEIEFVYLLQPPKRYTFEQPKLRGWIERNCLGKVLNLFAGKVRLGVDEVRVDSSNEFRPDYFMDAYDFVVMAYELERRFDTIVLDPPYGIRKSREKYGGRWIGSLTKIKNLLPQILSVGGFVISLGYDSVGMSKSRGFEKRAICLICHGGDHNDTIVLKEQHISSFAEDE